MFGISSGAGCEAAYEAETSRLFEWPAPRIPGICMFENLIVGAFLSHVFETNSD